MRKFTKGCLITALVFVIIGGILCIIGGVGGGAKLARELRLNKEGTGFAGGLSGFFTELADKGFRYNYKYDYDYDYDYDYSNSGWDLDKTWNWLIESGTAVTTDYSDLGVDESEIQRLSVSIGGAEFKIEESDNEYFGIQKNGKMNFQYEIRDGELMVEGPDMMRHYGEKQVVTLFVPKGMIFDELYVSVGAGEANLGDANADYMELELAAGSLTLDEAVGKTVTIDVASGDLNIGGLEVNELTVSTAMGMVDITGNVKDAVDVSCDMGSVDLRLKGKEKDFNYTIDSSMGSIDIGKGTNMILADGARMENNADKECTLTCSMGSIQLSFTGTNQ